MSVLEEIREAIIDGRPARVKEAVGRALAAGVGANAIINDGLIAGMSVIGVRFKNNEVYVPEVLIAAKAMHAGLDLVKPLLVGESARALGTVVMGTVRGDMHDIGKNLVIMMLESAGFKVVDLGVDVPAERFAQAVAEHAPQVVGLSALLTTTMPEMKAVIGALRAAGSGVKVMVGGAPVNQKFADEIGADGYAANAASAVDKARELLGV